MVSEARQKKIEEVVAKRQKAFIVVVEDIHDPHNAAAILRSCEAFGIPTVYFIFQREKKYNPLKIGTGSSSTANKWLTYKIFRSSEECMKTLKVEGYEIVGTVLADDADNIFNVDFIKSPKIALIVGNEKRGISEVAKAYLDRRMVIPMMGMVQSLNVSVTTALFIYEITRQRRVSKKDFSLIGSEKKIIVDELLER